MSYKKQVVAIAIASLAVIIWVIQYGVTSGFNGCGSEIHCFKRLYTSASFVPFFVPALTIIFSLIPLFFTKEHIYLAWRKFALVALPIVLIGILTAPASSGGWLPLGYDREFASMFFSGLFLAISWGVITRKTLQK